MPLTLINTLGLVGVGSLLYAARGPLSRTILRTTSDYKLIELEFDDGEKLDLEYFDAYELRKDLRALHALIRTDDRRWYNGKGVRDFRVLLGRSRVPTGV